MRSSQKSVLLVAWAALVLISVSARAREVSFTIDYFGFPLSLVCQVNPEGKRATSFQELLERDSREVRDCGRALSNLAGQHRIQGYAQLLLDHQFVQSLPRANRARGWISFSDAVLAKQKLGRNDEIALLYALLGDYSAAILQVQSDYYLLLSVKETISGTRLSNNSNYHLWEPGRPMDQPGVVLKRGTQEAFHDGQPVSFAQLPDLPWGKSSPGESVAFQSPPGCPESWAFSVRRRPRYEEFLSRWPRDQEILANLAEPMLRPFPFAGKFRAEASLDPIALGNCVFQWLQQNTRYAKEHAQEPDPTRTVWNPVETLLKYRSGVCNELSFALIGLLRAAGFPPENIEMAIWDQGTPHAHLSLGVAPMAGELNGHCHFEEEKTGRKFFIMDPALQISDPTQKTKWGDCPEDFKAGKQAEIVLLKRNQE